MPEIINGKTPSERFFPVIGLALIISLIEGSAQTSLHSARRNKNNNYLVLGIIFYSLVATVLFYSYSYEGMGHMNLVWSVMSIIVAYLIGYIVFEEPFNKYTCLAIGLGILAILAAHMSDETS